MESDDKQICVQSIQGEAFLRMPETRVCVECLDLRLSVGDGRSRLLSSES